MNLYCIYALVDPRNKAIRYIGCSRNVWQRYYSHLMDWSTNQPKRYWIEELREHCLLPELMIVENKIADRVQALEREKHWIAFYKDAGYPLTNQSTGNRWDGAYLKIPTWSELYKDK